MNNKIIMAVIGAIIVILLAVLVIYAASSLMGDGENGGLINFGGDSSSSEINSDASLDGESSQSGPITGDAWNEPTVGGDDGFEGSVIPGSGNSSSGNSSANNGSSSGSNNSSSGSSSHGGNTGNGNTGSNNGSGNTGSGSSSSSGPSVEDATSDGTVTYEEYIAMSGEEQQKYFESFKNIEDFFAWYNAAKEKYDSEHEAIEIGGDGEIDLGDIVGGNP